MRQARLIDADLLTIDSEPQAWSLRLPPVDTARYPTLLSAYDTRHAATGQ
jgi:hypothetical protein